MGVALFVLSMPVTLLLNAYPAWNNNSVKDAAAIVPTRTKTGATDFSERFLFEGISSLAKKGANKKVSR